MSTNNDEKKIVTNYDRKMQKRQETAGKRKKADWTTWLAIGIVAAFVVIVALVYFGRKNDATAKTYIKVGDHEITRVEYDYYYSTLVNSFFNANADYLMFMGIDTSKPLEDQMCIYDADLTWKDYFDQSAVPLIQSVKSMTDEARAKNFEYDVTEDYNQYLSSVDTQISAQGVSKDYFYEKSFGKYATEKCLEPFVKEYLLYQNYYEQLLADNEVTAEDVKAEYEANPNEYNTIDYRLYSMVAEVEDDADESAVTAAMDDAEKRANEMADRFKAGEDWRELCYEYAKDSVKDTFDPEKEADVTVVADATAALTSPNYVDWLYDDSRVKDDIMVYRDDESKACFIIVFDEKKMYDLEEDTADIAGTLERTKVSDYIRSVADTYEVSDPGKNLNYLYIERDTAAETEETTVETAGETKETVEETQETVVETE